MFGQPNNSSVAPGNANVTILNGGGRRGGGSSAAKLLANAGWDPNVLRTNTTLTYDEWKLFDNKLMDVARERLVAAGELMRRGLTYPIPNALGVMQLVWQTIGDMNPAEVTMTGLPEADADGIDFGIASMPIPMIHKEFNLDLRFLETSRRMGQPLDTTMAERAMRKVAELVDQIIFDGLTIASNLGAIYGLKTQPYRVTGSVTANWATAATGAQIVADVLAMTTALDTKNMFGPFVIFVSSAAFIRMGDDYKANGDKTILERVLGIPNIQAIIPTRRLTGTQVIMVQMTSDVIELIDGIQPTMVEWEDRGGFELNFMIFCIMLPRVRADQLNQTGIAHYT